MDLGENLSFNEKSHIINMLLIKCGLLSISFPSWLQPRYGWILEKEKLNAAMGDQKTYF